MQQRFEHAMPPGGPAVQSPVKIHSTLLRSTFRLPPGLDAPEKLLPQACAGNTLLQSQALYTENAFLQAKLGGRSSKLPQSPAKQCGLPGGAGTPPGVHVPLKINLADLVFFSECGAQTTSNADGKASAKLDAKPEGKPAAKKKPKAQPRLCCSFLLDVSLQSATNFNLVPHLIGKNGEHTKTIASACAGKVRIRGRGSGYREGRSGQEANLPLQVAFSCESQEDFKKGKMLISKWLNSAAECFGNFCRMSGLEAPGRFFTLVEKQPGSELAPKARCHPVEALLDTILASKVQAANAANLARQTTKNSSKVAA